VFVVNRNPSEADLRKFGRAMLIGFGTLGLILWVVPWLRGEERALLAWEGTGAQVTALCFWALGVALLALTVTSLAIARPVYVGWMSVAVPIGIIMSTVLLTLTFVILLPVFSLIVYFGDPMRRRLTRESTYWEDYKAYEPTLERMRRPF